MNSTTPQFTASPLSTGKYMLYAALRAGLLIDMLFKQLGASLDLGRVDVAALGCGDVRKV